MILRTKNINDNHLFSKNDVIYISNNLFSNYKKFLFNTFDTVLVMVGASIGKTGFITSNMMPALKIRICGDLGPSFLECLDYLFINTLTILTSM